MITVIDSSNLEAVLADAGIEPDEPSTKPEAEEKAEIKAEERTEGEEKPEPEHPDDDKEGPDGLTPAEKRELTSKMLKAVGKRVAQRKAAEEFADAQYQEKKAADRRAEDLERQINELKSKYEPAKTAPESNKPDRMAYATEAEFIEALTDWKTDQKFAQRDAEMRQDQAQAARKEKFERAKELVPDFEAEIAAAGQMQIPRDIMEYMSESDYFAELGYHFAKNPDVMKRLSGMTTTRQLVELGKIEATLTPFGKAPKAEPSTTEKPKASPSTLDTGFTPSKARSDAPVIRPLTSGEGQQVEPDAREMSPREAIQAWQRANKANLNLRKRH